VSSALHAGVISAAIFVTIGVAPATLTGAAPASLEPAHLVFLNLPGPGGGGGGGGRREPKPAVKAERAGKAAISSPVPERELPAPLEPEPEPPPPLVAETFPTVTAPVIPVRADDRDRAGVLDASPDEAPSQGPGTAEGSGTGAGAGVGPGSGSGIGPGSGGGTGGGPYRPGAGITPPRLIREVKAVYSEEARRAGISGDVVLEIVVRRDGSVGDVTLRRGLGAGLDDRAIQAVRQWRFSPATRQGMAVDVIVEVAVEFTLR
jgi:TonB family protein